MCKRHLDGRHCGGGWVRHYQRFEYRVRHHRNVMPELVGRQAAQRAALGVPRAQAPVVRPGAAQRQRDLQRSLALPSWSTSPCAFPDILTSKSLMVAAVHILHGDRRGSECRPRVPPILIT